MIEKQMKMQYISRNRIIDSIYKENELIIMTHISIAQHVGLKTFRVLLWYSLIVYSNSSSEPTVDYASFLSPSPGDEERNEA